jgi:hypothetical protein
MALEINDLMALQSMDKSSMTPYEQFKVQNMQARNHTSGLGIAGLTVGVGAAVLAIGGAAWAGSRAQNAKDVAAAKNDGLRDLVQTLATTMAAERNERIEGDRTLSISINDQVSGSQQGQLSASQVATNEATAQIVAGVMTGKYTESPQKVELFSPATPFQCGCGCNG